MASNKKRQQTMAKRNREQAVKERRALKQAKKHAAAAERKADSADPMAPQRPGGDERTFGPRA